MSAEVRKIAVFLTDAACVRRKKRKMGNDRGQSAVFLRVCGFMERFLCIKKLFQKFFLKVLHFFKICVILYLKRTIDLEKEFWQITRENNFWRKKLI